MTAAAERTASFADRLESAWAILVQIGLRAWMAYSEREKACVSIEDAMQAAVVELLARDRAFDPDRGRYVTFAKTVVRQAIAEQRRKARAVTAPASPYATLRTYGSLRAAGKLSPGRERTLERVRHVLEDQGSIPAHYSPVSPADAVVEPITRAEQGQADRRAVIALLSELAPIEAHILARRQGLFGQDGRTDDRSIARGVPGGTARSVAARAQSALAKARARTEAPDPPTEPEDLP